MIKTVYLAGDGSVKVFDERGQEIEDYGGPLQKVLKEILFIAPSGTRFFVRWEPVGTMSITREQFSAAVCQPQDISPS